MEKSHPSRGLLFLRDWKWLLGDAVSVRTGQVVVKGSFLRYCDVFLRSFLSRK